MVFYIFKGMLTDSLKQHISNSINSEIKQIQSVSGGDISSAYKILTISKTYFLKVNSGSDALNMFQTEAKALKTILATNTIKTPEIYSTGFFDGFHFILMDYIETKSPSPKDMKLFGEQLAKLHLVTSDDFGFEFDNFIGSLHQSNNKHSNWNDFYIDERLTPQLQLAKQKGLLNPQEIPSNEHMKSVCSNYFQDIKPSLLHGDLWSGNYVISSNGNPYLIDPATYFGHSEVDIAMSKLFGGFSSDFYNAYHSIIPQDNYTKKRIELYQLYYLLVHLNLFGRSYYNSVKSLLNTYF